MNRLEAFRIYYNQTIHPELMRMERRRRQLLRLLFFSALLLAGIVIFQLSAGILVLSLILMLPITGYLLYLIYRVREFVRTFKPHVMNLVLDFIDDGLNRGTMAYHPGKKIEKGRFLASRIFVTKAPYYEGEDFITGRVGEMDFELSELDVREISAVATRLDTVFKGVFLYALFPEETEGQMIIWPRENRQFHTRSIREFTWHGASGADHEIMNERFRNHFMTFATENTYVAGILTEPMQQALADYVLYTGKEVYASFQDQEIYIAVTEPKDILEPYIFRSNLSFELVREFFEDVNLLLQIVEEFDKTH